jgi:hypothetical protein
MSGAVTEQPKPFDWHDEYAYSLGVTALIYGFPYVYGAQIRHKWVTQPEDPEHVPYSAVNQFTRRVCSTPRTRTAAARTTTPSTRSPGST